MLRYEKIRKIGEGTYGKVYLARDRATGQLVALKQNTLETENEGIPPTTLREISLLYLLSDGPHVVRLLNVEQVEATNGKGKLYLVFEHMDADLKMLIDSYFRRSEKISPNIIKILMYQLIMGVAFCHGHGVMHRDVKPHNVLVNRERGLLKLGDLGLGRAFTIPIKQYTHEIVTLWYRAPEVLLGFKHYSTPVDIWSVGCIFAELYNLRPLFPGDSELQQLIYIFATLGTPDEEIWPGVTKTDDWHDFPVWRPKELTTVVKDLDPLGLDLLSRMLRYEPSTRISAKKALQHPYFDDLDKTRLYCQLPHIEPRPDEER